MSMVTLRDPIESDFETIFAMTQDPVGNAMSMVYPLSRELFEQRWNRERSERDTAKMILLGDEVVGKIGSFVVEGETHVGYLVAQAHWGKGVMSEALRQFLKELTHRPLIACRKQQHWLSASAGEVRLRAHRRTRVTRDRSVHGVR